MRSSIVSALLALEAATALQIGVSAPRMPAPTMMARGENRCALIDLTAEEPKRVAQVLKKAWMEGGVKVCISSGSCTDALLPIPSAEYVR